MGKCTGKFIILDVYFNSFLQIRRFFAFTSFIRQILSKPFPCIRHCETHRNGEVNKMNKIPGQSCLLPRGVRHKANNYIPICINTYIKCFVVINRFSLEEALLNLWFNNLKTGVVFRLGSQRPHAFIYNNNFWLDIWFNLRQ